MRSIFDRTLEPCLYLQALCDVHGELRLAVASKAPMPPQCPMCSDPSPMQYVVSARGETTRKLPFFENAAAYAATALLGSFSPNAQRLSVGQIVVYCEEFGIYSTAAICQVMVQRDAMAGGYPGVQFVIEGELTATVRHRSSGEVPFWCFSQDLSERVASPAKKSVRKAS
jgi:hypothetical protein